MHIDYTVHCTYIIISTTASLSSLQHIPTHNSLLSSITSLLGVQFQPLYHSVWCTIYSYTVMHWKEGRKHSTDSSQPDDQQSAILVSLLMSSRSMQTCVDFWQGKVLHPVLPVNPPAVLEVRNAQTGHQRLLTIEQEHSQVIGIHYHTYVQDIYIDCVAIEQSFGTNLHEWWIPSHSSHWQNMCHIQTCVTSIVLIQKMQHLQHSEKIDLTYVGSVAMNATGSQLYLTVASSACTHAKLNLEPQPHLQCFFPRTWM